MSADQQSQALTRELKEGSLQWYLDQPAYKARFAQILGERAPQFASSLISIANSSKLLAQADPRTLIAAGMIAATLDLPIDRNLGFAWIVPYSGQAQFQMGYRGYVQLAMRSGQYAGMNAFKVNAEALGGHNKIGDRVIVWDNLDETKPAVGYAFAWELVNGFSKLVYWPIEKVAKHAEKYSQSHRSHLDKNIQKGRDCRWCSDFDAMALKTIVKNAIGRWGIMSIQMQNQMNVATQFDQATAIDIEAAPIYQDNEGFEDEGGEQPAASSGNGERSQGLAANLKAQVEAEEPEAPAAKTEPPPKAEPEPEPEPEPEESEASKLRRELTFLVDTVKTAKKLTIARAWLEQAAGDGVNTVDKVPDDHLAVVVPKFREVARQGGVEV